MDAQEKMIRLLYENRLGRSVLKLLVRPSVSKMAGKFLDSRISVVLIPGFIKRNHIDMSQYEERKYVSYNDFFTRKVKPGCRKISKNPKAFIAPCDAKLSVYPITEQAEFLVKGTSYTMQQLVRSRKLAKYYEGGTLLLFRLTVDDYHRYCYVDSGRKSKNYHIPGVFHTVNPIANDIYPIYKENTREYSILKSDHFGNILMMEVGAMLVGRIVNKHQQKIVSRGQEKGYFEFGGSTIILCLKKGEVNVRPEIIKNTKCGVETPVKMGEEIGFL